MGTAETSAGGASAFSAAFLCSARIGCAQSHAAAGNVHTQATKTAFRCQTGEESDAIVDSVFQRIVCQVALVLDHAAIDIERTAHAPGTTQAADLGCQKRVGALALAVGTAFDRERCTRTASRHAVGTVVISLPEFVLGHVAPEQLLSHPPLSTGGAHRVEKALEGDPQRRHNHCELPTPAGRVRLRPVVETKNERKCQWATEAPYDIGGVFHARIDRLEAVGYDSKTLIAPASFRPAVAAIVADTIMSCFHRCCVTYPF